jgi:hypothetical protein
MPFGPSHEPGAENLQDLAPLQGHGLGHGQDQIDALRRRDERQRDARVAARRLDQDGLLRDLARLQTLIDHRESDAVLDARERVEELKLEEDVRHGAMRCSGPVQSHKRCVANGFRNVVKDFRHRVKTWDQVTRLPVD